MSTKDGGPAFIPVSLRDYFAAAAPNTNDICTFPNFETASKWSGLPIPTSDDDVIRFALAIAAKLRYAFADAMLAERERWTDSDAWNRRIIAAVGEYVAAVRNGENGEREIGEVFRLWAEAEQGRTQ